METESSRSTRFPGRDGEKKAYRAAQEFPNLGTVCRAAGEMGGGSPGDDVRGSKGSNVTRLKVELGGTRNVLLSKSDWGELPGVD